MKTPTSIRVRRILRNRLGIRNSRKLDRTERRLVSDRISEGVPSGPLDLAHLQSIHRHLFQDVYDWAGELRTVEISKGGNQFQFRQYITTGMADVHRRLARSRFLRDLSASEFAHEAGIIMGDLNYIHPFREGNGRVQLQYLKQLAVQAGHGLDLMQIDAMSWTEASKASHAADYDAMAEIIRRAIARRS